MAEIFLDTNILLYAISTAPAEQRKAFIARTLLESADWGWSAQVAAELVRASTSVKNARPLSLAEARKFIETWGAFESVALDQAIVLDAINIAERFRIFYFDAQVTAAAKRLGCKRIYTEDLNHGQDYGGVCRAENPLLR